MGSKLASKELVAKAGVPTLPSVDVTGGGAAEAAADIGYPVLIKASAGGGGKGMRIVGDPAGLEEAVAGAKREAGSAFGDDTVFLERYVERARHVEILNEPIYTTYAVPEVFGPLPCAVEEDRAS